MRLLTLALIAGMATPSLANVPAQDLAGGLVLWTTAHCPPSTLPLTVKLRGLDIVTGLTPERLAAASQAAEETLEPFDPRWQCALAAEALIKAMERT